MSSADPEDTDQLIRNLTAQVEANDIEIKEVEDENAELELENSVLTQEILGTQGGVGLLDDNDFLAGGEGGDEGGYENLVVEEEEEEGEEGGERENVRGGGGAGVEEQ
ncbi:hypothetical protein TrST_g2675 [Triparma strigata]|uniref:Uncharacterized protein n=1 Tax=Triparma strigata TaxID=1606541 RepID=A0A9W7BSL3_9STRA|nr:hypothetical protein TrST_g2675 [Triparma strigata]